MIEKIGHYSLENLASIYDEEAMTALELAGRTAKKVNEVIDQSNKLDEDTRAWMETTTEVTIPLEVEAEVDQQIKNGTFDQQIDRSLNGLNERVDNLLGSMSEGGTTMDAEVIDIRMGYDGTQHENAGNSVRSQAKTMGVAISERGNLAPIVIDDIRDGSVYGSSDGKFYANSPNFRCSRTLIPCPENVLFVCPERVANDNMMAICYDKNMVFIGKVDIEKNGVYHNKPRVTPPGTRFIGFNVSVSNTATSFTLVPLSTKGVTQIDAPVNNSQSGVYWYCPNAVCTTLGWVNTSDTMDAIVFPVDSDVKYITLNYTSAYNCICLDAMGNCLSAGNTAEAMTTYRLHSYYPIPEGTALIMVTMMKSHTHDDVLSDYVTLSRDKVASDLDGKRVLVIGDSVSYMDGMSDQQGATRYQGWQKQLRKRGALVYTEAWSGYTYASGVVSDGETVGSIYEQVVTNGLNVADYDIVILAGGLNDTFYDSANKSITLDNYTNLHEELPVSEMAGGLARIINYIRTNNQTAEIYLCGLIPSGAGGRPLNEAVKANGILQDVATAFCLPFIPLHNLMNTTPTYNHHGVFFDDYTHPNKVGQVRLGTVIAKFIENVTE